MTDIDRRAKFSHDPNNTAWTNSTDSYGQRMLQSHGWTTGASLGARNKSNTRDIGVSHFKVTIKGDTLGLGARLGPNVPQPGLDAFQGLLGRLNGKTDPELAKEQDTRDNTRRKSYAERRWGGLHFVSGGLLIGDRIEEVGETEKADSTTAKRTSGAEAQVTKSMPERTGTRDVSSSNGKSAPATAETEVIKKSKKRKKYASPDEPENVKQNTNDVVNHVLVPTPKPSHDASAVNASEISLESEKVRKRAEKAQRKVERRARKKEKRALQGENGIDSEPVATDMEEKDISAPMDLSGHPKRPILDSRKSDRSNRSAVRSRYILQKKMALADPRALNEVCRYYDEWSIYSKGRLRLPMLTTQAADTDDKGMTMV